MNVANKINKAWENRRFLPVLITDTTGNLNQAFLYGLNDALKRDKLNDLVPNTYYSIALDRIEDWKQNYTETYESFEKEISERGLSMSGLKTDLILFSKDALDILDKFIQE